MSTTYYIKSKFRTHLMGISLVFVISSILIIGLIENSSFVIPISKIFWYIWIFLFTLMFLKFILERLTYKLNFKDGILEERGIGSKQRQLSIEEISRVTYAVYSPFEEAGHSQGYRNILPRFSNYNLTWDGNNPFPKYPINSQLLKDLEVLQSSININDNEENHIEISVNKNQIRRILNLYIQWFFISILILIFPLLIFVILDGIRSILN